MEELGKLSPASRETSLDALPRKELQQLAKETGVKGNSKSKDIVQALLAILDGSAEATAARADSTDYASSSMPPASVHKQPANETLDSASTFPAAENVQDTLLAESEDAIEAQLADALNADSTERSPEESPADVDTAVEVEPAAAASDDSPVQEQPAKEATASKDRDHLKPEPEAHTLQTEAEAPAASVTAVDAATSGRDLTVLEPEIQNAATLSRPQNSSPVSQEADQLQPTAAAAQSPDCISNPLFEEPSAAQLVEPESIPAAPQTASVATSETSVQQPVTAGHSTDVTAAVHTQPDPVPASSTALPPITTGSVDTSISTATIGTAVSATGTVAIPQAVIQSAAAASQEGQRGTREPTPEDVANLGKAVSVVQARSCQLSPSLLTLQNSADMGSPANDAFERGRKSGIWQGATEVELRQLERQWDDYKLVATRGWELPNLQDVQAKSDSLAASGFATVGSPILSKATREAMAKQGLSGKRKARSEEAEAPAKRGSTTRKVVKRAAGLTPSRKGGAPQGTPLRPGARANGAGPSRLAQATHASDVENTGKAANAAGTPLTQGKASSFGGLPPTPFSMGTSHKTAGTRGSKAVSKSRPANERAKKAEATFAARRAAALAKGKK